MLNLGRQGNKFIANEMKTQAAQPAIKIVYFVPE